MPVVELADDSEFMTKLTEAGNRLVVVDVSKPLLCNLHSLTLTTHCIFFKIVLCDMVRAMCCHHSFL